MRTEVDFTHSAMFKPRECQNKDLCGSERKKCNVTAGTELKNLTEHSAILTVQEMEFHQNIMYYIDIYLHLFYKLIDFKFMLTI
jgi:hypothetical protein